MRYKYKSMLEKQMSILSVCRVPCSLTDISYKIGVHSSSLCNTLSTMIEKSWIRVEFLTKNKATGSRALSNSSIKTRKKLYIITGKGQRILDAWNIFMTTIENTNKKDV